LALRAACPNLYNFRDLLDGHSQVFRPWADRTADAPRDARTMQLIMRPPWWICKTAAAPRRWIACAGRRSLDDFIAITSPLSGNAFPQGCTRSGSRIHPKARLRAAFENANSSGSMILVRLNMWSSGRVRDF
jgi:hypothetical protein